MIQPYQSHVCCSFLNKILAAFFFRLQRHQSCFVLNPPPGWFCFELPAAFLFFFRSELRLGRAELLPTSSGCVVATSYTQEASCTATSTSGTESLPARLLLEIAPRSLEAAEARKGSRGRQAAAVEHAKKVAISFSCFLVVQGGVRESLTRARGSLACSLKLKNTLLTITMMLDHYDYELVAQH